MKNNLLFRNKKIGVAVSGGVDSIVLLDLFNRCKHDLNIELYAFHYNHKWRKKSYKDALLVENYCKRNNIKFIYKEFDGVPDKNEETARNLRYSFFKEAAVKNKIKLICTAHHKDDQIETILFRLVRGTGPKGLLPIKKAMKFSNSLVVYRPILDVMKKEIYDFAKDNDLPYIEDYTNKNLNYKRNLIRQKIIPELNKINNNAGENLLLCSELIHSQYEVLAKHCQTLLKELACENKFSWNRRKFINLDQNTQVAFVYWFLAEHGFKGSVSKFEMILDAIRNLKSLDLSNEYFLRIHNDKITFEYKSSVKSNKHNHSFNKAFLLNNNKSKILFKAPDKNKFVLSRFSGKLIKGKFPKDKEMKAFVDLSSYTRKSLSLRYRKPSDVFQPLGLREVLKLKKYLINKKISVKNRYNIPMLCFNNEILWLPGYSLSEKIKVTSSPTHILEIINNKEVD